MKLTSIQLHNYRPFYGQTPEIVFATRKEQNTTVIHGNNGAGKTAILNAFTWVLYEQFTPGLADSKRLVNKRAIAEARIGEKVECWVKISFKHNDTKYSAKRVVFGERRNDSFYYEAKSELTLQCAGDDGRWVTSSSPKDIINRVLPEKLRDYFFFDGERIEKIVQADKKAQMSDTTKILLGVEALDRAIKHLGDAERDLEQDYQKITSPENASLIQEKQDLEDKLKLLKERQDEIDRELKNYQKLEDEVQQQLRSSENVRELQKRRDYLNQEIDSIKEKFEASKKRIKSLIARKSYTIFLAGAIDNFRLISNELRERGELPSGIKQQFVKDLLQQRKCICGTQLLEETLAYSLVEKWMDKAGIGDIEETVIRMGAEVDSIDKDVSVLWQDIEQEKNSQEQLKKSQSDIETEIEDIHDRLRNSPLEDIRALENRYEKIKKDIERLTLEKGENKTNIENYDREINLKNTLLLRQQANEVKQKIALLRIKVTQEAIDMLSRMREIKNKRFRAELEQSVQNIFGKISFKPYIPKLNDNYELTLIESTSGVQQNVPASSGENVILSLSFISSIISKVREWSRQNDAINLGSGIFPIVMDSPFSKLDTEYKKRIATAIPQLADQLILITNKAHWVNEVEEEMNGYIGKHYVLTYFSPKPDYNDDSNISLYDCSYPLVKRSPNDWEYTEILEVNQYN